MWNDDTWVAITEMPPRLSADGRISLTVYDDLSVQHGSPAFSRIHIILDSAVERGCVLGCSAYAACLG